MFSQVSTRTRQPRADMVKQDVSTGLEYRLNIRA